MSKKKKQDDRQKKFIFVTGGVVSSIGKGLTAASLGALLEARGYKVTLMKCDPYINVDPGTMSPFQHGEVFVTDDGAETDLDLGHYERFTSMTLGRHNSITAGQIYESVIRKERRGDYLGGTVQVIPHITDEIKSRIYDVSHDADITIVEIGGTIGDIEGLPFVEAIRQMRVDIGIENTLFIHVTYIPYIAAAGELKSKPTQHSVKELRAIGIQPDFLICRCEHPIELEMKSKIGLFCSVRPENVIAAYDAQTIYEVPLMLHKENFDEKLTRALNLKDVTPQLKPWEKLVDVIKNPKKSVTIGLVGKYVDLKESYKSLSEAISHGGASQDCKVNIEYVNADELSSRNVSTKLKSLDGILVPGGFGERGAEGKILAIRYARENDIPFFGICLGMQLASVEFARNVCGIKDASSHEFSGPNPTGERTHVIHLMDEQRGLQNKGATMRLGSYPCSLRKGSLARKIYGADLINERHRHRFEFNNQYREEFEEKGMIPSGICEDRNLVEIIELKDHPFFIGVQFHPEFQSKPLSPHPLFREFIQASLTNGKNQRSQNGISRRSEESIRN